MFLTVARGQTTAMFARKNIGHKDIGIPFTAATIYLCQKVQCRFDGELRVLNRELYRQVGYTNRQEPEYFDGRWSIRSEIVFQPEIYPLAETLLAGTGRRRLVDVGCGIGKKLAHARAAAKLGMDFGDSIRRCRENYPDVADWRDCDLGSAAVASLADEIGADDVVLCSGVIELIPDPRPLLEFLSGCFLRGALVITSTPDRMLLRGADHLGPPPDPGQVREWTSGEYRSLLLAHGLPPFFLGLTYNNDRDRLLRTIVSVHEPRLQQRYRATAQRPLAIMSCFNEEDVLGEIVEHWIAQGCDLHILDNWSTDRTASILATAAERFGAHLTVERFSAEQPTHGSWRDILQRKEDIAFCHQGRWIVHTDADEIRHSPFASFNLADAMHLVELAGWNRIDFTLLNHRPTDAEPFRPGSLASSLPFFEFGTKPGHFIQKKAWLQGGASVRLADSGGHVAEFADARDCPYHFILHHYPLRSVEHGSRKINQERYGRWSADEFDHGWHRHYEDLAGDSNLIWDMATLQDSRENFWASHGLPILSGLRR